jgi:hypothetical protein
MKVTNPKNKVIGEKMKKRILVIYCIAVLLCISCGTVSNSSTDNTNSNIKQFPVKQIQVGKNYNFTLTEKRETDNPSFGKFSGNVNISGKVIEIDKESGWLKIQSENDKYDYIHFSNIERFSESTKKTTEFNPANSKNTSINN